VQSHPNPHLTPRGRARVFAAVEAKITSRPPASPFRSRGPGTIGGGRAGRRSGELASSIAAAGHIARQSGSRWRRRQRSRALRQKTARGADFLAALLGLPAPTVHRVSRRQGLLRQRAERAPVVRYQYTEARAVVHVDTKKLGRIVGGPGHRIHRRRSREQRGVGWEAVHMAIDDATRLVYAEILGDENGRTMALLLVRAVRWFREHGIAWIAFSPTTAPLQIQGVATRLPDGRALPPRTRPSHP
jgi:hypothetical protein